MARRGSKEAGRDRKRQATSDEDRFAREAGQVAPERKHDAKGTFMQRKELPDCSAEDEEKGAGYEYQEMLMIDEKPGAPESQCPEGDPGHAARHGSQGEDAHETQARAQREEEVIWPGVQKEQVKSPGPCSKTDEESEHRQAAHLGTRWPGNKEKES